MDVSNKKEKWGAASSLVCKEQNLRSVQRLKWLNEITKPRPPAQMLPAAITCSPSLYIPEDTVHKDWSGEMVLSVKNNVTCNTLQRMNNIEETAVA
ncbi:unnamed protein product, partial [Toxocara canis]|uniref:LysM domain-containing protein n=1 Tax=Toxocara canis TaxID=6265 RepID=A0A183U2E4_TOXCA